MPGRGWTSTIRTQGEATPDTSYEARTKAELEEIARQRGVENYSELTKEQLIEKLRT